MKRLYFIAIELPEPYKEDFQNLKKEFSSKYHAKHALKTPPHITLQMPMRIEEKNENELIEVIDELHQKFYSGMIYLNDVSSFPSKTIFIDVLSQGLVLELFEAVKVQLKKKDFIIDKITPISFHPHITLLTRDLSRSMYSKALEEISKLKFNQEIEIDAYHLYKHDGKFWQVLREFKLLN